MSSNSSPEHASVDENISAPSSAVPGKVIDEPDSEPPHKKRRVRPLDEKELVAIIAKASRTEAWESRIPDWYVGTSTRGRSPNSETAPEEHGQVTRYRIRHRGRPVVKIPRGSPLHEPLKEKECGRLFLGTNLG